ncbi:hypothetical protein [Shewanella inventionis]|nr:hypothetical protein [Shewanella inventionis]MCL1156427.1 hypothetical protein [Shewanella inventionis]
MGIFIFGETPDTMTLLGSLLVVVSGVYTLSQTRKKVSSRVVNSEA